MRPSARDASSTTSALPRAVISGAATVPVALAVGEKQRSTGKDFLAAVVVGCDVMYRLLAAVRPSSGKRGFS